MSYIFNPKTLQYIMQHSDISVTLNVYTHVGFEDAEKEMQRLTDTKSKKSTTYRKIKENQHFKGV